MDEFDDVPRHYSVSFKHGKVWGSADVKRVSRAQYRDAQDLVGALHRSFLSAGERG